MPKKFVWWMILRFSLANDSFLIYKLHKYRSLPDSGACAIGAGGGGGGGGRYCGCG